MKKIIAIDGPSASGKGTLAKNLAARLNFFYLDTGSIYRLLGLHLLTNGVDPDDPKRAAIEASRLAAAFSPSMIDNPAIRNDLVADAASRSSRHPEVRMALLDIQRTLAENPPGSFRGTVMDGRDTGTIVCPDAPLKLFLTADSKIRAQRRAKELQSKGLDVTYEAVLQDLETRDTRDANREVAPLRPAEDAATVDTTNLDADAALEAVLEIVRDRFPGLA